jgi:hypothetical protein
VSRPLRSVATPASSGFPATTGRSAGERRAGTQCLRFLPRHAPSRDLGGLRPRSLCRHSPSHVPCKSRRSGSRRLYAGHHLANTRAPARLIPRGKLNPRFRCHLKPFDASTTTPGLTYARPSALERLPDPHLTRSSRAFSPFARHDGLRPTQQQGGLAPAPADGRRRASNPPSLAQHRLCEGSSTWPLPQRS